MDQVRASRPMHRGSAIIVALMWFILGYASLPDPAYPVDSERAISTDELSDSSDSQQVASPLVADRLSREKVTESTEADGLKPQEPLSHTLSSESKKTATILEVLYLLQDIPGHEFGGETR